MQVVFRTEDTLRKHSEATTQLLFACLMTTPSIKIKAEFKVTKVNYHDGFIDILLEEPIDNSNISKQRKIIIIEFKNKIADFLNVKGNNILAKSEEIKNMDEQSLLNIKVAEHDKFDRGLSINQLIDKATHQVNEYKSSLQKDKNYGPQLNYVCYIIFICSIKENFI